MNNHLAIFITFSTLALRNRDKNKFLHFSNSGRTAQFLLVLWVAI